MLWPVGSCGSVRPQSESWQSSGCGAADEIVSVISARSAAPAIDLDHSRNHESIPSSLATVHFGVKEEGYTRLRCGSLASRFSSHHRGRGGRVAVDRSRVADSARDADWPLSSWCRERRSIDRSRDPVVASHAAGGTQRQHACRGSMASRIRREDVEHRRARHGAGRCRT